MDSNETENKNENETKEVDEMFEKSFRRKRWAMPFIFAAMILIKSAVVMVIWNLLIPDLFHGPMLTYVQALGLSVLAKLLVGFHGFGGRHGHHGGPFGGHHRHWRHRMHHKWANLSPEEREKAREKFRGRCSR